MKKSSHDNNMMMWAMMAMCAVPLAISIMSRTGWPVALRILVTVGALGAFWLLHHFMMKGMHGDHESASKEENDPKDIKTHIE